MLPACVSNFTWLALSQPNVICCHVKPSALDAHINKQQQTCTVQSSRFAQTTKLDSKSKQTASHTTTIPHRFGCCCVCCCYVCCIRFVSRFVSLSCKQIQFNKLGYTNNNNGWMKKKIPNRDLSQADQPQRSKSIQHKTTFVRRAPFTSRLFASNWSLASSVAVC